MMQQNFEKALACTLREEGGFTSDPRDKGGPTNLGVTQRVWETYIGHAVDDAAMRALTLDDVRPLYRAFYWNKIAGDALPSGLDLALFDFAVNSGPSRASLTLQSLLSVKRDGIIGPNTLGAIYASKIPLLIAKLSTARLDSLRTLPAFSTFGKGWTARVNRIAEEAAGMCGFKLQSIVTNASAIFLHEV